jgi:hypothetical protein
MIEQFKSVTLRAMTVMAASLLVAGSASAGVVGYRAGVGMFGGLGGNSAFDALFAAAGDTVSNVNLSNAASVNAANGLWLAGGSNVLTATEQANLLNYLNAGGHVVYITDRSDVGPYATSTNSVLGIFGADDIITGGDNNTYSTVGSHALLAGVANLRFNTWSAVNTSLASPTLLTANGMAAVYKVGAGELLFIGDTNWQAGAFGAANTGGAANVAFANNIVNWLTTESAATVPEPSSLLLVAAAGMALMARRRKAA